MTEWRPVPGYEGLYEVSDDGQVRSLDRIDRRGHARPGCQLAVMTDPKGYLKVSLCRDGSVRQWKVHHLTALAYLGPRPDGMDVCHNDGNPADNRAANLRYDSRSANILDEVRHGTHKNARVTSCPKGHPYDEENTYVGPAGRRFCRACNRERARARRTAVAA